MCSPDDPHIAIFTELSHNVRSVSPSMEGEGFSIGTMMNDIRQQLQQVDDETRVHQELTSKIRFKQNLIHGIGAATVFGLATGASGLLFGLAAGTVKIGAVGGAAMLTWPAVVLGISFVVGVGCLYLSSKYISELVSLEQNRQARQIVKGMNGKAPEIEPQKPITFPSQDKTTDAPALAEEAAKKETPAPTITNIRELQDKVVPLDAAKARTA